MHTHYFYSEMLMYQILVYGFANFSRMTLSPAPKLLDLLHIAVTGSKGSELELNVRLYIIYELNIDPHKLENCQSAR